MSSWKQEILTASEPVGCGLCWFSLCCPCLLVKRNADDMGRGDGLLCCLLQLCLPNIPICVMRAEARERYSIDGSTCNDIICSCCCAPAVNWQIAVEISERGDGRN